MTPVENLLARLPSAKKAGDGWSARCPAHEDHKASLSVSEGDDGTALLKCHAGCNPSAILSAVGLTFADLYPPKPGPAPNRNGKPKPSSQPFPTASDAVAELERRHGKRSALWIYYDARGETIGLVVRWDRPEGKDIRPVARHADGWRIGAMPDPRPLYALPELAAAERAIVCEGEKAADAARTLGFIATTSAGGSQAAGKTDWRPLAGKEVWILPDNDAPGHKYADTVAGILTRLTPAPTIRVVELSALPDGGDIVDWIDAHGDAVEPDTMRSEIETLSQSVEPWRPTVSKTPSADERPSITITTEEHEVNEKAVHALARDDSIYQRGNMLVRIVRDGSPASRGIRRPFTPRIDPLPAPLLRERLAANASWIKLHEGKDGAAATPAHPPTWCVSAVHARGEWPGIRHLEAVVDYPVLRPDGTILCQPGYDPATGLLLDAATEFPEISDRPSQSDAIAARDVLLEVVADFPFERPVHQAAWLAGLLTPLARFAFIGPAPLFLVDSNTRGAGKGLLLDCVSRIATGERFTIAAYTSDEDELRKRITSLALAGDRLVLFDNLDGKFGNAVLDAALTGTNWKDRVLGVNRMAEAPLFMTWYATGNNVCIAADTARRVCHVRLESPEERPEERQDFRHRNLLAWVGENRFKLLAAALTILRAYCAAGRPDQRLPAWGSFEGWSGLVRSAVVWIDMPDPGETRLLLQEHADLGAESMSVILAAWEKLDTARRGLTAAEVVQRVKDSPENPAGYLIDLREALEAFLGKLEARLFGNKLRSYRRRIFAGRYIDKVGTEHSAARWAVFPASQFRHGRKHTPRTPRTPPESGECGESGESLSAHTADREASYFQDSKPAGPYHDGF
jgi:hypothetical protein